MPKLNGSFKIDIPATSDLHTPSLECDWEAEFDGDAALEKVLKDYFQDQYEKSLKAVMASQTDALMVPVKSMQTEIDQARQIIDAVNRQTDMAAVRTLLLKLKERFPQGLDSRIKDYNGYLAKGVENIRKQQLLVHAQRFEEAALAAARKQIKKDLQAKKFRVIAGVTLRGSMALAATGAAVAGTVASFGTALPVLAGIGAASAGLGGVAAASKIVKSVLSLRDLEGRAMRDLMDDLAAITGVMDGVAVQVKGLSEHFDQLSAHYSDRRQRTVLLSQALAAARTAFQQLESQIAPLQKTLPALYQARSGELKQAQSRFAKAQAAWDASVKRDEQLKKALEDTARVVAEVSKVPSRSPKGSLDALKRMDWTDSATYIDLADSLSSLTSSISGLGTAV